MNYNKISRKLFSSLLSLILIALSSAAIARADGEVDTSFGGSAYSNLGETANVTVIQPDGKILVGGNFNVVSGSGRGGIARINTDGTVDATFNPPDLYDFNNGNRIGGIVKGIGIQSNGKIVVAGQFNIPGLVYKDIVRLNTDGSVDNTFADLSGQFGNNEFINDVIIAADDSIYIGGNFDLDGLNGTRTYSIGKLTPNGSPDFNLVSGPTGGTIREIAVQPDGKVIASDQNLFRMAPNGDPDSAFQTVLSNNSIDRIVIQPDGKILIGGTFTTINGFSQNRISRLNTNGSIDTTFNISGAGANNSVSDISLGAGGSIYVAGNFTTFNAVAKAYLVKLNADGTIDNSFNPTLTSAGGIKSVKVQADGKVIILDLANTQTRLNTNGTLDATFARVIFGSGGIVNDILQQPDGKILAGGRFIYADTGSRLNVARFNADGTLDTTFNLPSSLFAGNFYTVNKLALQPDGKILVAGNIAGAVIRLNSDGSRDTSFALAGGGGSYAGDVRVLSDGRILVDGNRYLSNGANDSSFTIPVYGGSGQQLFIQTVAVQPDGKILVGGSFTTVNGVARGRIVRLNADGSLDTTFAPPLGANNVVNAIDLQTDGKIVLGGTFDGLNGDASRKYLGRLNSDGSLDSTFSPVVNNFVNTVKIQSNGKILFGGFFTTVNGVSRNRYARLNSDGSIDNTFSLTTGANVTVNRINLQFDGKILLGGNFTKINGLSAVGIARLGNASAATRTPYDFDGDGRADLSVFRPSTGTWYIAQSSNNAVATQPFGTNGDSIAPADFDGDGKTDLTVFRPSTGTWYIQRSSLGFTAINFGASGDLPVPGDYDGDGKADIAVYRPSNNYFYVLKSSDGQYYYTYFGIAGDIPTPGDYDRDGKIDIAVFRPSNGTWYRINSSTGQWSTVQFGQSGDLVVPADYDADGFTDIAVFRPSNGTWYLNRTTAGFTAIQFGANGDKPAPADYDGDGRIDLAVFRPSTGVWYLNRSTSGFAAIQFGISEDLPAPNAYIR